MDSYSLSEKRWWDHVYKHQHTHTAHTHTDREGTRPVSQSHWTGHIKQIYGKWQDGEMGRPVMALCAADHPYSPPSKKIMVFVRAHHLPPSLNQFSSTLIQFNPSPKEKKIKANKRKLQNKWLQTTRHTTETHQRRHEKWWSTGKMCNSPVVRPKRTKTKWKNKQLRNKSRGCFGC